MVNRKASVSTGDYERKKLDVNLFLVIGIAVALTLTIYALFTPFQTTYFGTLLFERGFTQYFTVGLACAVISFVVIKFTKIQWENQAIRNTKIQTGLDLSNPDGQDMIAIQRNLARSSRLLAIRCSRILTAYTQSGSRKTATEFALDDSAFYLTASESSYAFPRILVWAIPLLGFIGTVIGISQAVNGFSGFLDQTSDVEQIKSGIGTVTKGLAVAFDTTLLALFLSVVVMIPLVLVERFESRLLLKIDVFINDQLLPRFKEDAQSFDERVLNKVVTEAIQKQLPSPESLIQPAEAYAKQAANYLIDNFKKEVEDLQKLGLELASNVHKLSDQVNSDRLSFKDSVTYQQDSQQHLINQLVKVADSLEIRVQEFSQSTDKIKEITQLSDTLNQLVLFLERSQTLNQSLQDQLQTLKPTLERMSRPRLISFVDPEEEL
ncbi:MAG: MotA/TolQ/ExbB proton channel family protein [Microcystaceae cyanobacterium]